MADTEDEKIKAQIKSIKKIVENYLSMEEFDVTKGDFECIIKIGGELPLGCSAGFRASSFVESPWLIKVSDNRNVEILSRPSHKLTFSTSSQFNAF